MTGRLRSKLGLGPMSSEVIEAVYRYSQRRECELMLVTSKNQVDYAGGYVNNWRTSEFAEFLAAMRSKYPASNVMACRDHCGPGFNGRFDLEDTYRTIEADVEAGFALIHIDFCHQGASRDEQMVASKKAIEHCLRLNPALLLEVGTDDTNICCEASSIAELERELAFFAEFCSPVFYVVNTGALVREMRQCGVLNHAFARQASAAMAPLGFRLKEHQCDYLSDEELALRNGIVAAMNVAPQLGVVQTAVVLGECERHGISTLEFLNEVYDKGRWRKWMVDGAQHRPEYCARIAAHYHFGSDSYKRVVERLSRVVDIRERIMDEIDGIIARYDSGFERC